MKGKAGDQASGWRANPKCLTKMESFEEAEDHLQKAYQGYRASKGENHRLTHYVITLLAELHEAWGKPDQVAEWRSRIR